MESHHHLPGSAGWIVRSIKSMSKHKIIDMFILY
jgi:hypothetical protein